MHIYWNKTKRLHRKRAELPQYRFGTPIWPPFYCLGYQHNRRGVMWKGCQILTRFVGTTWLDVTQYFTGDKCLSMRGAKNRVAKRRNARQTMWDKYPRDERRNGSLFLSCSVSLTATVRDGKCFRSKSFVKCVIEKIMHPGTTGG